MVEIKALQGFVLLLLFIGMLLGIGVVVLDQFQIAARTTTSVVDSGNNLSVTGTVDFTDEWCIAVTSIGNITSDDEFTLADYNVTFSDEEGCVMSYSGFGAGCWDAGDLCNVTYTYGAATTSATSIISTRDAITPIASTWLPLIVTIFVLAIILGLVIRSFGGKSR